MFPTHIASDTDITVIVWDLQIGMQSVLITTKVESLFLHMTRCTWYNLMWERASWPWSYGSWIYYYLCNQCLSPLRLWVQILIRARCTTLCDKVFEWLGTNLCFSLGPPVSSTNKIDRHDIAEILLKVALNTIKQTNKNNLMWLNLSVTGDRTMVFFINKTCCNNMIEIF